MVEVVEELARLVDGGLHVVGVGLVFLQEQPKKVVAYLDLVREGVVGDLRFRCEKLMSNERLQ